MSVRAPHSRRPGRIAASILAVAALLAHAVPAFAQAANAKDLAPIEWDPWYVLLPIDQPGGAARISDPRPVEDELANLLPGKQGPDLSRTFQGKKSIAVSWKALDEAARVGSVPELAPIDFLKLLPKDVPGNDASAYLYRKIRARAGSTASFKFGYDDAARIWLNGKLISESTRPGAFEPLADTVSLDLQTGDNHLLVKVTNGGGAWRFRLLSVDAKLLTGRASAQQKVNRAIERGCEYLISQQLRDGSWGYDDSRFPGGQTALCVYALLKSGITPRHQAIQRGIAYLRARPSLHTYTAGCTLLALWALNDRTNDEWVADIADELLSWQQAGVWAYPEGECDLSNTQYAVLGLLAASRSGFKVPPKAWRDMITQVLHFQGRPGGFGYKLNDALSPTGSMTAAGLSVLAIAKDQLIEGSLKQSQQSPADEGLAAGASWLSSHFTITGSPPNDPRAALDGRWGPYYLYGVERACTLLGMERLGGSDWYWEGATWFLDVQGSKGEFSTAWGESEPNTCFALLFLGRATASFTGKGADNKDTLYQTDDAKSDVWLRASGDAQLALWIGGFSQRALKDYSWQSPQGKGLRVSKVEYLVDGEVAATVNGNASKAWNGEKYSLQHRFKSAGPKRVAVRAHLMLEPETEGGDPRTQQIESNEVEILVTEITEPRMLAQAGDATRNLIRGSETKAQATTQSDDHKAGAAVDGRESRSWICAPDDKQPALFVEFTRPLRTSQIVFSGLGGKAETLGHWDRATKVELRINKDPPIVVALDGDEMKTTLCELARPFTIRTLEIKVVERAMGTKHPGRVGFNEIALYYQPPIKK